KALPHDSSPRLQVQAVLVDDLEDAKSPAAEREEAPERARLAREPLRQEFLERGPVVRHPDRLVGADVDVVEAAAVQFHHRDALRQVALVEEAAADLSRAEVPEVARAGRKRVRPQ